MTSNSPKILKKGGTEKFTNKNKIQKIEEHKNIFKRPREINN